jgi:HAD superfamily hydrolase (TIGR01450 family)
MFYHDEVVKLARSPRSRVSQTFLGSLYAAYNYSPKPIHRLSSQFLVTKMFPFGKEMLAKVGSASDDEPESAAPKDSNSDDMPARTVRRRLAIAFDVSGVVCSNDNRVLPNARETICFVQQQHIPFIFLTNSGGNTDQACAEYLSRMLNLQLSPQEVVQSHTPWLDLVPLYVDKNVLVLGRGGNALREAAHSFGFKNVILDVDLAVAYADIFVTGKAQLQRFRQRATPLPKSSHEEPFRIHAIFVPQDPEDWALDATLIAHLLCSSKGQVGTVSHLNGRSDLPNHGYCQDDAPTLYLCNLSFAERPRQPSTGVPTDGVNQVSTPCRPSKPEQRPHLRRTFVETVDTHYLAKHRAM